jgi:hypothetical protein
MQENSGWVSNAERDPLRAVLNNIVTRHRNGALHLGLQISHPTLEARAPGLWDFRRSEAGWQLIPSSTAITCPAMYAA